jgi:hypothetical protein
MEIRAGIHQQLVKLSVFLARRGVSRAGTRSEDDIGDDQREHDQDKSCHAHESCVGNRPRALWFDAGQCSESRDKQCDDQPREPSHAAVTSTYLAV